MTDRESAHPTAGRQGVQSEELRLTRVPLFPQFDPCMLVLTRPVTVATGSLTAISTEPLWPASVPVIVVVPAATQSGRSSASAPWSRATSVGSIE